MTQQHDALAFGIVRRLRMVFVSISLVLVSAMVIGVQQLLLLENSTIQLTQSSVPVFERAEELERNLKNLLLLLQQVDTLTHQDSFENVQSAVETQLTALRSEIRRFAEGDQARHVPQDTQAALEQIERSATVILTAKRAALGHTAALDEMGARLATISIDARHHLEQLSFNAPVQAPDPATGAEAARPARALIPLDAIGNQLSLASTITQLTLELEAILDITTGLRKQVSSEELDQAKTTLSFKIRGITVLLGRLPKTPERAALASTLIQLRALAFDEAGLFASTRALLDQSAILEREKSTQAAPIEVISTRSHLLTQSARAQMGTASERLNMALDSVVFILVFSAAVALLVILSASIFIVELQINRRMAKLTGSVLAIAEGRNDTEVDVSGPDELGKIARALEVFKLNALELQRSNTELEKFAYVAAHDLRSPLRAIQDLTDWTLEDPDTVLSEDGQHNMELLQQRIMRLNQLLSDLLEYSRVGKEASDLALVSLDRCVAETAELLDPEGHFSINYTGPQDPVLTFATPLRHILLNLINNAIKHHDRAQGQITVEAHLSDGQITCVIRDDGPGIEPQYHERIFNLFQTLRPRDEVEGSGLGLAIIRKLLEHHGGSIRVRSDPEHGRGTEFIFTLPQQNPAITALDRAA